MPKFLSLFLCPPNPFAIALTAACCSGISPLSLAADDHGTGAEIAPQYQQEVNALTDDRRVRAALDFTRTLDAQSLETLVELTEIPAPPFAEETRAVHYAQLLRQAGLGDVVIDEVGNVIGRRPGKNGDKLIALAAHLDTVFPAGTDVTVKREGETLRAPGIGDNTRGLVLLLEMLQALDHAGIETEADVLFIGNVGEEGLGDLKGTKHLFREGAEPIDTFIAIDGGDTDSIVYGGVGSHRYRVTYSGPGGHSWRAFGLANPQHALGRAIALFDERAPAVTEKGPKTSYNVGRIGGGTSINSIPFEAWMEIDMRSGEQYKLDEIDAVLQAAVQDALVAENAGRLDGPPLTVEVKRVGTRPAAPGDASQALVQRAMAATAALGISPTLKISSTDSNLPISKGIPAVTMSRGGVSKNAHSLDEWWQNRDAYLSTQIALLTLLAEAGLAD